MIFDTGTSLLLGPEPDATKILNVIEDSADDCIYYSSLLICACTVGDYSEFPDIEFTINNDNFILNPESYLLYDQGYCYVLIGTGDYSFWLLGQPFFRQFYTVHDMDNKKIHAWNAISENNSVNNNYIMLLSLLGIMIYLLFRFLY